MKNSAGNIKHAVAITIVMITLISVLTISFASESVKTTDVISNDNGKNVSDSGLDFMYNYTVDGKYQFRYRLLDKNGNV